MTAALQNAAEEFLSPPSARRATLTQLEKAMADAISIPALREEGDANKIIYFSMTDNFYPRPPRGGRLELALLLIDGGLFLSPPSARRATSSATGRTAP